MSRLDSFIRRMQAQRSCLDRARDLVAGIPGPVLELGLGNGRTYDHLRELFPDREIFAFDRQVAAHPACIPDDDHLFLGPIEETLPAAAGRIGAPAALVHMDIGTVNPDETRRVMARVAESLPALMAGGGCVVSDQELCSPALSPAALPDDVKPGRYFMYRYAGPN